MRSTIACERCRQAKVKCIHDGKPPCRRCVKSKVTASCVLSGPIITRRPHGSASGSAARAPGRITTVKERRSSYTTATGDDNDEIARFHQKLSSETVVRATATFQAQFPELGFLHPRDHDLGRSDLDMLRQLAIVAVARRYHTDRDAHVDGGPTGEECADVVTRELHRRVAGPGADLVLVQTFLVMALWAWGEDKGFTAWMYAGIAARMAQGCIMHGRGLSEAARRTVWSCFTLDKLLGCGSQRPALLRIEELRLALPIGDEDYAFDAASPSQGLLFREFEQTEGMRFGGGDGFSIVVQGLEMWSRIHAWTVEGGRKGPGMTEPHNSPWREGSAWACMRASLMRWRERQPVRLRYPETKVAAHAHLRRGEMFGYINLIYYLCLHFLCREFIPFLPLGEVVPRGPIDPPLLKEYAPEGFWLRNRDELFDASAQMGNIIKELRHAGVAIRTPFTGLCAFACALFNRYAASFPQFAGPEFAAPAEQRADESSAELRRISELWPVAQGWLDVLATAERLFSQVSSPDRRPGIGTARDNHLELEASMNLAPLSGMPGPTYGGEPALTRQRLDEDESDRPRAYSTLALDTDLYNRLESDGVGAEGWGLWAFWDGPHLLSTGGAEVLQRTADETFDGPGEVIQG